MKPTPVGVAQKKVLDAIGETATDWSDAQRKFEAAGLEVGSKRVGRTSEPVVTLKPGTTGGWNAGGDGESVDHSYRKIDLSKLSQWIRK